MHETECFIVEVVSFVSVLVCFDRNTGAI